MADFEIEDTGPGIPADELERIFEPFVARQRRRAAARRHRPGPDDRTHADRADGRRDDRCSSTARRSGTLFRIRLFLPELHGARRANSRRPQRASATPASRRRILVVDNEEVDRELLVNVLEPLGFERAHRRRRATSCLALLLRDASAPTRS